MKEITIVIVEGRFPERVKMLSGWTGSNGDEVFQKHNKQENYILGEQISRARNP